MAVKSLEQLAKTESRRSVEMAPGWGMCTTEQHADSTFRASSSFAPTARSSASRTARPSPSSFSARTPAASPGPYCAGDSGGRVSLRYARTSPCKGPLEFFQDARNCDENQNVDAHHRSKPRPVVAAKSSHSVPLSVPRLTSSRSAGLSAPKLAQQLARKPPARQRRSARLRRV